jgi:hypothetical protein
MANGTNGIWERKAEISTAAPERYTALRQAAENLSRRNVDVATCEVLNEALGRLIMLLYETDAGGLANIDSLTGRVLIPMPNGKNGHAKWGLRSSEANVLRDILFAWQQEPQPLLLYDWTRHSWFVNIAEFGSIGIAKAWLRAHQVSVGLYRSARAKRVAR